LLESTGSLASAMQQLREPRVQLLFAEELLRLRRVTPIAASRIAVQQKHRRLGQELGGGLAGVDRDELDPRALLEIQIDIHAVNATFVPLCLSIELW